MTSLQWLLFFRLQGLFAETTPSSLDFGRIGASFAFMRSIVHGVSYPMIQSLCKSKEVT